MNVISLNLLVVVGLRKLLACLFPHIFDIFAPSKLKEVNFQVLRNSELTLRRRILQIFLTAKFEFLKAF